MCVRERERERSCRIWSQNTMLMNVYVCLHLCIFIYIYIYIYIISTHICIHTYIHTCKNREKERERYEEKVIVAECCDNVSVCVYLRVYSCMDMYRNTCAYLLYFHTKRQRVIKIHHHAHAQIFPPQSNIIHPSKSESSSDLNTPSYVYVNQSSTHT